MIAQMIPGVIKLLTKPRVYWDEMIADPGDARKLLPTIIVLSALPAVAMLLGGLLGGLRLPGFLFLRFFLAYGVFATLVSLATNVAAWFLMASLIDWFAGTFGAQRDPQQARKLATAIIPMYLGGVLAITTNAGLTWLGYLAGLGYGFYILALGLPVMNGTPADKAYGYAGAVVGCTFVVIAVMNALVRIPISCCVTSAIVG